MEKIPVNIITGFLGAGKTTAIIKLLSQKNTDDRWAVIINEFGKVSIDTKTLQSTSNSENVYEITGGCICCTAKAYLNVTLQTVIQSGKYSRIIIEPTGLGGVDMVSEIVESQSTLFLNPVICLVDIQGVTNPKLNRIPVFRAQISKSDWVVLTKTDLISDSSEVLELKQQFLTTFPTACLADELNLLLLDGKLENKTNVAPQQTFSYLNSNITSNGFLEENYTFEGSFVFDSQKLSNIFQKHPSIIRAKGFVNTKTGWILLNYSLSGCIIEPIDLQAQTQLVVIADKSEYRLETELKEEINQTIITL
ncbi:MAG: GTP-binding protein [Paludibacter sp.]